MMKRKFLAVILPIIGCATVVGSGFSAWYFGEYVTTGANGSTAVNVDVTDEIKTDEGNLKFTLDKSSIDTTTTLILDQGGAKNESLDSGIMFGASTDTQTTATNKMWKFKMTYDGASGTVGTDGLTIFEVYNAGLRIRFAVSIELTGNLGDYVTFKSNQELKVTSSSQPTDFTSGQGFESSLKLAGSHDNSNILTGDYIIPESKIRDLKEDATTLDWTFELNLNTIAKEGSLDPETQVKRKDYSNALLLYKDHSMTEGEQPAYNGGKPMNSGEPAAMEAALKAGDGSNIKFSVVGYIEDDTTR